METPVVVRRGGGAPLVVDAAALAAARRAAGLEDDRTFAVVVGLSLSTVRELASATPGSLLRRRIADALGVDAGTLWRSTP